MKRYIRRPAEEVYHTATDAFEMHNLATHPKQTARMTASRQELDRWMRHQGDPGAPQDTQEVLWAARLGKHL